MINFNFKHIAEKNLNPIIKQAHRAQIYVGFQCHQKCGFCYYKHKCSDKMFDIQTIYRQIDLEYSYGIRDFEITGGEPSEYEQLREVCLYIKEKSPASKIAIITNGGLWKSNIWDLIDEVLISYHLGIKTKNYNTDIFPLGCTYNKVVKTVEIAKQHNVIVRTNTVVGTFNIESIHDIVEDLISFKPLIINFLPVNLFDESYQMFKYIDYNAVKEKLKLEIQYIENTLDNSNVFIRYIPFCNMEGFEHHILGHLQHAYDWFDWNVELSGIKILDFSIFERLKTYGLTTYDEIFETRKTLYEKSSKCIKCKYFLLCDGVEKTNNHELLKYIQPTVGKIIKDPMYYIKDKIQQLYFQTYNILNNV